jgi:sugar lactone lactonase YvrE
MTEPSPAPRLLVDGLVFPESARWHEGRLWFAHWGTATVVAVDLDGKSEVVASGPAGYGWSIDWLPDGRRLTTGPSLTITQPDGSTAEHGQLRTIAEHGWNEIAVTRGGNVYLNGFEFDLAGGGLPQPGVIALVRPDGSTRQVADELLFPNGMVITPDESTLIVAESFAGRLTAYDIDIDGGLLNRRVWASPVAPDGICMDVEGAIWSGAGDIRMFSGDPNAAAGAVIRVHENGEVGQRVEIDRPSFSCALGGPDGTTLFLLGAEWRGFDRINETAAELTGRIFAVEVAVPGIGV